MPWEAVDPAYSFDSIFTIDGRRMAKDLEYLTAVRTHWKEQQGPRLHVIERSPITYVANGDDPKQILYGQLLRRVKESNPTELSERLPAILLFHTAAGPQDVFLYYKADVLLQNLDCIVMICDILSDADGWAWEPDRTRYNIVKMKLMDENARLLRARVMAAIQTLLDVSAPDVAIHQIAAMGFCLGGQPIIEVANLSREHDHFSVRALITFHGVFARATSLSTVHLTTYVDNDDQPKVLICNGDDDPFVTPRELEGAADFFQANGFAVEVLRVAKAKHGFTNPAQELNSDPAFGFSPEGSVEAWARALGLLRSTILP